MNNIQQIILSELEKLDSCCLDNADEREKVAKALSDTLITQSLQQLATLLDGSIECDSDGKVVICTGLNISGLA